MSWWKEEDEQEEEYELIKKGLYTANLDNVLCDQTKIPQEIKLVWKITGPEFKGRTLSQSFGFAESRKKWLSWQLGILGAWQAGRVAVSENDAVIKIFDAASLKLGVSANIEVTHYTSPSTDKTYANAKIITVEESVVAAIPVQREPRPPSFISSNDEIPF